MPTSLSQVDSIRVSLIALVQNEFLHPNRHEDFNHCLKVWQTWLEITIEILTPVVQIVWEAAMEVGYVLIVEAIHLSEDVGEWLQYWWNYQREPQLAYARAWIQAQKPRWTAFLVWLASTFSWLIQVPDETLQFVDSTLALPSTAPVRLLTASATVESTEPTRIIIVPAAVDQRLEVDCFATDEPAIVKEQIEKNLTADALKLMTLPELRAVAPQLGIANAIKLRKKNLLPQLLQALARKTA